MAICNFDNGNVSISDTHLTFAKGLCTVTIPLEAIESVSVINSNLAMRIATGAMIVSSGLVVFANALRGNLLSLRTISSIGIAKMAHDANEYNRNEVVRIRLRNRETHDLTNKETSSEDKARIIQAVRASIKEDVL